VKDTGWSKTVRSGSQGKRELAGSHGTSLLGSTMEDRKLKRTTEARKKGAQVRGLGKRHPKVMTSHGKGMEVPNLVLAKAQLQ